MVTVTVAGTVDEVMTEGRHFFGFNTVSIQTTPPQLPKELPKAKVETAKVETPKAETPKAETAKAETPKTEPPTNLLDEIKAIVPKLVKEIKREGTAALFAEFSAKSVGDLKPDQYATFLTAAKAKLPKE